MEFKTPITILQEYTAKNQLPPPNYLFYDENSPEIAELEESEKVGKFFAKCMALNLVNFITISSYFFAGINWVFPIYRKQLREDSIKGKRSIIALLNC